MIRRPLMNAKPSRPFIFIVGATGTGKSELAISLASRFNGEIINSDALQLYEGLSITTNKVPVDQRRGIPHHLLGCIGLQDEPWTVRQFHERAKSLTDDIHRRGRLPIVVGGTHHYLQSLLAPNALVKGGDSSLERPDTKSSQWPILEAPAAEMLAKLRDLDPEMAKRWHPNDKRKIRRSLEICLQQGRPASQVYFDQRCAGSDDMQTLDLINGVFPPSTFLVLWTHAPAALLNPRLDTRVDHMVNDGLLREVKALHEYHGKLMAQGCQVDDSHGIWTAIGYKELLPIFNEDGGSVKVETACIDRIKIATRQYAKSQTRWIRSKLISVLSGTDNLAKLYLLDASEIAEWSQNVEVVAANVVKCFLAGDTLPCPSSLSKMAAELLKSKKTPASEARHCSICDKTLMTEEQWNGHLKSKGHRVACRPPIDWAAYRAART